MPAVAGVWGPNVWGPNVWGAHVWGDGGALVEDAALSGSASSEPVLSASISGHPMSNALTVGSTNTVALKGLKNVETRPPLYLNDATVELTGVYDENDVAVTGTENISMPYISGVGHSILYRGTIPHTAALVAGQTYTRRITAVDLDGNVRVFDKLIVAAAG